MQATFMYESILRNLPAVPPLNKIAADSMMLPAGVSLTCGWFDHDLWYPQCEHACLIVTNVPCGFVVVPGQELRQDGQCVNSSSKHDLNTMYFTSSSVKPDWIEVCGCSMPSLLKLMSVNEIFIGDKSNYSLCRGFILWNMEGSLEISFFWFSFSFFGFTGIDGLTGINQFSPLSCSW